MTTTQEDINNTLWKACDTFRGKIDASIYKDYILVMLFIKYLSDTYKEHQNCNCCFHHIFSLCEFSFVRKLNYLRIILFMCNACIIWMISIYPKYLIFEQPPTLWA